MYILHCIVFFKICVITSNSCNTGTGALPDMSALARGRAYVALSGTLKSA